MPDEAELHRRELKAIVILQQHRPVMEPGGKPIVYCWCGWMRTDQFTWDDHIARYMRNAGCFG